MPEKKKKEKWLEFVEGNEALEIRTARKEGIEKELALMKKGMAASGQIFKTKIQELIDKLETREVSEEQIINILLEDFENDGEIFGGLKRSLIGDAREGIKNIETEVQTELFKEAGEEKLTWICAFVNTCEDCLPLHGQSKTLEEWKADPGLPGSGWSVCREHCQCVLMPSAYAGTKEELSKPIQRAKKVIKTYARKIHKGRDYINRKLGKILNPEDNLRGRMKKII